MLHRNFELISIKVEFFMNFKSCSKIRQKSLYYSTGILTYKCLALDDNFYYSNSMFVFSCNDYSSSCNYNNPVVYAMACIYCLYV